MPDFSQYVQHGWALCEIAPGRKGPRTTDWNEPEKVITDPTRAAHLHGAGLCHAYSGTCALDVDSLRHGIPFLEAQGIDLGQLLAAQDSVHIVSGKPDHDKLLYTLSEPLPTIDLAPFPSVDKNGKTYTAYALELRSATRELLTVQDVLPGTLHPELGTPYSWAYGDDLFGTWQNLPPLPAALEALWRQHAPPAATVPGKAEKTTGAEHGELVQLLEHLDPDMSHDDWVRVGMALHHETRGSLAGLAIFDAWSARGKKYGEAKGAQRAKFPRDAWRSFKWNAKNPVTLGSLRRQSVASPLDFPIVPPEAAKLDTRPDAVMQRLLESRLVFIVGQDRYFDLKSEGESWLNDRAVRHLFCPHVPSIVTPGKNGKADKVSQPDPVIHLMNSRTKKIADAVGIHPGESRFYTEDGRRFVNRYTPLKVEELVPLPREIEAMDFLWSRMKDEVFRKWFRKFLAFALQNPGVKIQTAPLVYSQETGTFKNTLMRKLPQLLYGYTWVKEISGDVLRGNFTDTLGETWWIYFDELHTGSTKAERVALANKIKGWLTNDVIEVHPKGLKPYNIRNRLQFTATSNFDDAIHLDNNDRRWAVSEMKDTPTEKEVEFVYEFLNSSRAPGVLRYMFMHTDTIGFNPTARAPLTTSKLQMMRASQGTWESKLIEAMVAQEAPFDKDIFTLQDVTDTMIGVGPSNPNALARMLKSKPFCCGLLSKSANARYWAWRNVELWRKFSAAQYKKYVDTGKRPASSLPWSNEVPRMIRGMSIFGDEDEALDYGPLQDLIE